MRLLKAADLMESLLGLLDSQTFLERLRVQFPGSVPESDLPDTKSVIEEVQQKVEDVELNLHTNPAAAAMFRAELGFMSRP